MYPGRGKYRGYTRFTYQAELWLAGGFVAFRAMWWGNCSRMLWIELAVCLSVCTATDRHNKSIITIINRQSIKPVCCSASHRQRYGDCLFWVECQGVRVNTHLSVVLRLRASGAVTALACTGRLLPYISCQNSTSREHIEACNWHMRRCVVCYGQK